MASALSSRFIWAKFRFAKKTVNPKKFLRRVDLSGDGWKKEQTLQLGYDVDLSKV
jgi:hypothetical protein